MAGGRSIDEDTRALVRSARAIADEVDRLRRRLERERVLLTPRQYDRIATVLAGIGMLGGVLLAEDAARTDEVRGSGWTNGGDSTGDDA